MTTAREYRSVVATRLCIVCGDPVGKHVRCDDCHDRHNRKSVASYGAETVHHCRNCGEVGHNRRRCPK